MTRPIDPRDARFVAAAAESDWLLHEIERGWKPAFTAADLRRARDDALHAIARDLPDPADYAAALPPEVAGALMEAVHGRNGGLWAHDGPLVPILRSLGLVAINDRQLTGFAIEVRYALRATEGEYLPPAKRRPVSRTPASRPLTGAEMGNREGRKNRGPRGRDLFAMPPDIRRVEHSAPCGRCGSRMDACQCRSARA